MCLPEQTKQSDKTELNCLLIGVDGHAHWLSSNILARPMAICFDNNALLFRCWCNEIELLTKYIYSSHLTNSKSTCASPANFLFCVRFLWLMRINAVQRCTLIQCMVCTINNNRWKCIILFESKLNGCQANVLRCDVMMHQQYDTMCAYLWISINIQERLLSPSMFVHFARSIHFVATQIVPSPCKT